jgi:HEAT repeat protein
MALGEIGSPEARATLKKFENDKEPLVRVAVHEALAGATS